MAQPLHPFTPFTPPPLFVVGPLKNNFFAASLSTKHFLIPKICISSLFVRLSIKFQNIFTYIYDNISYVHQKENAVDLEATQSFGSYGIVTCDADMLRGPTHCVRRNGMHYNFPWNKNYIKNDNFFIFF